MKLDKEPEDPKQKGMDYKEPHSIPNVFASVVREKHDPESGLEPISPWLVVFVIAVSFVSGGYLFKHSGGFRPDVYESGGAGAGEKTGGAAAGAAAPEDPVQLGQKFFGANCVSCHQANGAGVPGKYPPLAGSSWVTGSHRRLAAVVLNGLEGPVTVNGVTINGSMPAWKKDLNDKKIAYILTYIRSSWGNQAPAVTIEEVAALRAEFGGRKTPWKEAEIMAISDK